MIHLDDNASTPFAPEVRKAMLPYLEGHYGSPSSTHYRPKGIVVSQRVRS